MHVKGYVIMHSPFHFSSDSDAAFRRDRLRMVLRPRITGHKFRLYPGFRRARHVRAPTNRIQAMGTNGSRVMNQKCTARDAFGS